MPGTVRARIQKPRSSASASTSVGDSVACPCDSTGECSSFESRDRATATARFEACGPWPVACGPGQSESKGRQTLAIGREGRGQGTSTSTSRAWVTVSIRIQFSRSGGRRRRACIDRRLVFRLRQATAKVCSSAGVALDGAYTVHARVGGAQAKSCKEQGTRFPGA